MSSNEPLFLFLSVMAFTLLAMASNLIAMSPPCVPESKPKGPAVESVRTSRQMPRNVTSGSGHAYGSMLLSACFPLHRGRMAGIQLGLILQWFFSGHWADSRAQVDSINHDMYNEDP